MMRINMKKNHLHHHLIHHSTTPTKILADNRPSISRRISGSQGLISLLQASINPASYRQAESRLIQSLRVQDPLMSLPME